MSATAVAGEPGRPLLEATAAAGTAAALALLLIRYGPPGTDMAAHAYQRTVFLDHGLALWNNLWYSGRYSFVTYSLVYYPLAALLGIRVLAVATIALAALAFSVLVWRQWGAEARWASRTFAPVLAAGVLSAAFPFAVGMAFGLVALCALQADARWAFAALVVLTAATSPVAFLLLGVVVAGSGLARLPGRSYVVPAAAVATAALAELLLWRLFPSGGRYPFSREEFAAAAVFCALGCVVTWRVERARPLRLIFPVYFAACVVALAVPTGLGENVCRLRFVALPLAVLALSLRRWRPAWLAVPVLVLACSWNTTPLIASFVKSRNDPSASAAYWAPAVAFLRAHLRPSYRVEAVDTVSHWEAVYLPEAGIPLVRGWFRQDDHPQNDVLYEGPLGRRYLRWLRGLGVRYVVLTRAPTDYSARREASLLSRGRSGLEPVFRSRTTTIFAVPSARPIVRGPGYPRVVAMTQTGVRLRVTRPGHYRLAVRYSPYWRAPGICVARRADGMTELTTPRAGAVALTFDVTVGRALDALRGRTAAICSPTVDDAKGLP
ncbi:MAG TPA: hypothetical protein VFJ60_11090 [Gaiella sp.]|nr:hypothetical protein [Gaiella sp.]